MGSSKDLFLKMSEQEYFEIPEVIRQTHLNAKIYQQSTNDFDELMQDETYSKLYKHKKQITADLNERQYQLRENKRNKKQ